MLVAKGGLTELMFTACSGQAKHGADIQVETAVLLCYSVASTHTTSRTAQGALVPQQERK